MRYPFLLPALAMAFTANAQDEGFRCLANNPAELSRHLAADPHAALRAAQAKAALDARTGAFARGGGEDYVIPVVFHVIHNNGTENISDAQVQDAVRILNEDYNKLNPDWTSTHPQFIDIVADVGIQFRLAQRDPEGNCTNGITRTQSTQTNLGDFDMTQLIQWPRDRYLNIWVCRYANGAAGYTYYPIWLDGWPEADGIVVRYDYVGSIGTSSAFRSRALSHEVGHWLNLKHCWGDSNEPGDEANCFMDDDVDDTPLTRGWTSCVLSGASCGSTLDNVQNYMEYAYCARMFSNGQADRMIAALTSPIAQRENLWQPANLALTGVDGSGTVCEARFTSNRRSICSGGSVNFSDQSFNGIVQRAWSFPGGEPATSTEAAPAVTYPTTGEYEVTLTVTDANGNSLTQTETAYIRVLPSPGQPVPWNEDFESASDLPNETWEVIDPSGDGGFLLTTAAAYSGTRSARLPNTIFSAGRTDELISNTFDLSGAPGGIVSFRYAYAKRYVADDDELYVYVSANCGDTWLLRKIMRGNTSLLTAGVVPGAFTPTNPEQWRYAQFSNIGPNLCTSSFRLRFVFLSNGGNDLYLDDINVQGGLVGIDEVSNGQSGLRILLDASAGTADAMLNLERPDRLRFDVLDPLGRVVSQLGPMSLGAGSHRIALPVQDRAAGGYMLRVSGGNRSEAVRFVMP
ncbi:MAG: PKD domain-containing protein [Flavobacteriales bacterium]|nr:PKD domain-containing protein [Flavobacteriales bacterium]